MPSHYRHQRSSNPATPFPTPVQPGEIVVNTANRQIAVGDADSASLGMPKNLLAVRIFDAKASYVANDLVTQGGKIYRANAVIPPGAFNAANWTEVGAGGGTGGGIPEAPTDGQTYGRNSAAWVSVGSGGGLPDAPADGQAYGRYLNSWWPVLDVVNGGTVYGFPIFSAGGEFDDIFYATAGGEITGQLKLADAPTLGSSAANKDYVDGAVAAGGGGGGSYLPLAGGTLTGNLTLPQGAYNLPTLNFAGATNCGFTYDGAALYCIVGGAQKLFVNASGATILGDVLTQDGFSAAAGHSFYNEPGSGMYRKGAGLVAMGANGIEVMTWNTNKTTTAYGPIVLPADPAAPLQAATKQYVDGKAGGLPLSGGALTGPLALPDGTVTAPALKFTSEPSTGFFFTPTAVNITVFGVQQLSISANSATFASKQIFTPNGTASIPPYSFTSSNTSGLFLVSSGVVGMAGGGNQVMSWNGPSNKTTITGPILAADGAVAAPSFTFTSEPGSGLWRKSAGIVSISANTNEVMNWNTTSKVTTALGNVVVVAPAATDNSTKAITSGWHYSQIAQGPDYWANVETGLGFGGSTLWLSPVAMWQAAQPQNLNDAATITMNMSNGGDFTSLLGVQGGAARAIANPTNIKLGQKGVWYLIQDSSGNRAISSWGTYFKFPGGIKPVLSTAPNAVDVISYAVKSAVEVHCWFSAGMA